MANEDLEIRGAGNLLGDEQSGHVKDIGIELYQSMLKRKLKNKRIIKQMKSKILLILNLMLTLNTISPKAIYQMIYPGL